MEIKVTSWPLALVQLVFVGVVVAAIVVAWVSADRVVAENRSWTRAWRILVCLIGSFGIGGVMLPFGATYILVKYGRSPRKSAPRSESVGSRS